MRQNVTKLSVDASPSIISRPTSIADFFFGDNDFIVRIDTNNRRPDDLRDRTVEVRLNGIPQGQ